MAGLLLVAGAAAVAVGVTGFGNTSHALPQRIGQPVVGWGVDTSGLGTLFYPVSAAVDGRGDVYVLDQERSRVQKFSPG
jgi:hypothetical protein